MSSSSNISFSITEALQEHTSIFGIRLWIVILSVLFILFLILTFLYFCIPFFHCCPHREPYQSRHRLSNSLLRRPFNASELERDFSPGKQGMELEAMWSAHKGGPPGVSFMGDVEAFGFQLPLANVGRTRFSAHEIEAATNTYGTRNLIGYGESSVVYHGVLFNGARVAVKRLLNNSYEDDEELKLELDAITNITHKNLVKLLGYCLEGEDRMLVYEYIDNGSLNRWLHIRDVEASALTWDRRMTIIRGTAKGLAYLQEDLLPGIVHGNIKSSNIVLDQQWNPKISDIGSALLFNSGWSPRTPLQPSHQASETAFGEISAEKSTDVYCFGILVMEIVTGRLPVYLIDSVKSMIANQEIPHLLDPRIPEMPPLKDLKWILLIAMMCVDPDLAQRPKIGHVVRMLETPSLALLKDISI
ncbi:hypothetical protein CDL15_Pgr022992 [Punica granatum]|uniref:non-specific serine/threonine protein kinase n=1 Tax=Punica granatum TaxID=22663 RepID=A0A218X4G4_PUNGR|nr:hypothetical protein CDL15_Pgr022992 [Punica granatum]